MVGPRIFVLFCVLLGGTGQGVVAPNLPQLLKGSDELALASGLSAALMYLGIFVSTYRYGKWADAGKVHWLLVLGLFSYAACLIALGVAVEPRLIYAIRFFEGLALSAVFVAADFVLGRLSKDDERGQWLSYYGVALSIGLLLGPALSLILGKISLLAPLCVVAALAVLAGSLAIRVRVPRASGGAARPKRLNFGALTSGAAYGYLEAGLVAVLPVLAVQEFHVVPEYLLFTIIVAAALSSIGWGMISDRMGARPTILVLLAAMASGPLVFAFAPAAFTSAVFFGVLAGGIYPVGFSWLLESVKESQYGFASGSFARAYGVGSLVGPLSVGFAAQRFGAPGMFLLMSGVGAVAVVIAARSRP